MASETLRPLSITIQTNCSGSVSDLTNDPDSGSEGNWVLADSDTVDVTLEVNFPDATNTLTTGSGLQEIRARVRESSNGDTPDNITMAVYEGANLIATLYNVDNPGPWASAGGVISGTFDASLLSTQDPDADVRVRITCVADTFPPAQTSSMDVDSIEWNVDYTTGDITGTGDLDSDNATLSGSGKAIRKGTGELDSTFASVSGTGKRISIGTGSLISGTTDLDGSGGPLRLTQTAFRVEHYCSISPSNLTFAPTDLDVTCRQVLEKNYVLRFGLKNNTIDTIWSPDITLYVSKNGGAYTQVTTVSSIVTVSNESDAVTDGAAVNQAITSGGFVTGKEWDSSNGGTLAHIPAGYSTEVRYEFTYDNLDPYDYLEFKIYQNGVSLDTYNEIPKLTADDDGRIETHHFRFCEDDDTVGNATWLANNDTDITVNVVSNEVVRLRFQIYGNGSASSAGNGSLALQYELNEGTPVTVTDSTSVVALYDSSYISNPFECIAQLNFNWPDTPQTYGGAGSSDPYVAFFAFAWTGCYWEVETALEIKAAQVSDGDTIDLYVPYLTTSAVARINITKTTIITGTGELGASQATQNGNGFARRHGNGNLPSGNGFMNGWGRWLFIGTGDLQASDAIISGSGSHTGGVTHTGTGALDSGIASLDGVGYLSDGTIEQQHYALVNASGDIDFTADTSFNVSIEGDYDLYLYHVVRLKCTGGGYLLPPNPKISFRINGGSWIEPVNVIYSGIAYDGGIGDHNKTFSNEQFPEGGITFVNGRTISADPNDNLINAIYLNSNQATEYLIQLKIDDYNDFSDGDTIEFKIHPNNGDFDTYTNYPTINFTDTATLAAPVCRWSDLSTSISSPTWVTNENEQYVVTDYVSNDKLALWIKLENTDSFYGKAVKLFYRRNGGAWVDVGNWAGAVDYYEGAPNFDGGYNENTPDWTTGTPINVDSKTSKRCTVHDDDFETTNALVRATGQKYHTHIFILELQNAVEGGLHAGDNLEFALYDTTETEQLLYLTNATVHGQQIVTGAGLLEAVPGQGNGNGYAKRKGSGNLPSGNGFMNGWGRWLHLGIGDLQSSNATINGSGTHTQGANYTGTGALASGNASISAELKYYDSLWGGAAGGTEDTDSVPIEVGVELYSTQPGRIVAVEFERDTDLTGPYVANIWNKNQDNLATKTFSGPATSGWNRVWLDKPVITPANTIRIASYHMLYGKYTATNSYFYSDYDGQPPLIAPENSSNPLGEGTVRNGCYTYNATSIFPVNSYADTNYWVDVLFEVGNFGEGSLESGTAALSGTGAFISGTVISGTGALNSNNSTLTGSGKLSHIGTGLLNSDNSILSGQGHKKYIGTGSLDSNNATLSGAAKLIHTGTGILLSGISTINGSGQRYITGIGTLLASSANISGSGKWGVKGSGNLISGNATINGSGGHYQLVTGTGNLQSNLSTITGSGELAHTGTGTLNSGNATINGNGGISGNVAGSGNLQSGNSTLSGAGELHHFGTGSLQGTGDAVNGSGKRIITGTGTLNATNATITATAVLIHTATGNLDSGNAAITGTGIRVVTGSGDLVSGTSLLSGAGTLYATETFTGTGALISGSSQLAGTGKRIITGSGNLLSGNASLSGNGSIAGNVAGTGTLTSGNSNLTGAGHLSHTGTGTLLSTNATLAGVGEYVYRGAGNLESGAATIQGTGSFKQSGTGSLISSTSTISGVGRKAFSGTGELLSNTATLSGTGITIKAPGTGQLISNSSVINGSGILIHAGTGLLNSTNSIINGAGHRVITGSGNLNAGNSVISGDDNITIYGTGNLQATAAVISSAGFTIHKGSGNLLSSSAAITGVGFTKTNGTGDLQAQAAIIDATGKSIHYGTGALISDISYLAGFAVCWRDLIEFEETIVCTVEFDLELNLTTSFDLTMELLVPFDLEI